MCNNVHKWKTTLPLFSVVYLILSPSVTRESLPGPGPFAFYPSSCTHQPNTIISKWFFYSTFVFDLLFTCDFVFFFFSYLSSVNFLLSLLLFWLSVLALIVSVAWIWANILSGATTINHFDTRPMRCSVMVLCACFIPLFRSNDRHFGAINAIYSHQYGLSSLCIYLCCEEWNTITHL